LKHVFRIKRFNELKPYRLKDIFPLHFVIREENGYLIVSVEGRSEVSEGQIFSEVQRECDLIFFLTGIDLEPELIRIEGPDGSKRLFNTEAGLIRNWAGHKGVIGDPLLRRYCAEKLRISERFYDPTDNGYQRLILRLVEIVRRQAGKVIDKGIEKGSQEK